MSRGWGEEERVPETGCRWLKVSGGRPMWHHLAPSNDVDDETTMLAVYVSDGPLLDEAAVRAVLRGKRRHLPCGTPLEDVRLVAKVRMRVLRRSRYLGDMNRCTEMMDKCLRAYRTRRKQRRALRRVRRWNLEHQKHLRPECAGGFQVRRYPDDAPAARAPAKGPRP
jgi:hypothetical protein